MTNFMIGLLVGGVVCFAALTHHPVIAKITHSEGGDTSAKFLVDCQTRIDGRVKCAATDIQKDK